MVFLLSEACPATASPPMRPPTAEVVPKAATARRQIEKLVDFIAEGNGSKSVADKLKVLEREADSERRDLALLSSRSNAPIKLPPPDEMLSIVFDLERRITADVTRGREELRRLFRDGRIDLIPQPDGFYVARSTLLPMVLLMQPPSEAVSQGGRYPSISCAGRI